MPFTDQFSAHAASYGRYRPSYPEAMFDTLSGLAPGRSLACDVATGSGQAARGLARRFQRVVAVDGAFGQVAAAPRCAGVDYVAALAESFPLATATCDLVVVAQSLHWLERPAFFAEVERVLVAGGVLGVSVYTLAEVNADVNAVLAWFYHEELGGYWLPGREFVDDGYRSVPLPFTEVAVGELAIVRTLTMAEYVGYVGTWSAVQRCRRATGRDPMGAFVSRLGAAWGPPEKVRAVRWPLHLRVTVKR